MLQIQSATHLLPRAFCLLFRLAQLTVQLVTMKAHIVVAVQEQAGQQMQEQKAQLESLQWTLADARRLLGAVGAVESHGPTKTALQVCSMSTISYTAASAVSAGIHMADEEACTLGLSSCHRCTD